MKRILLMVFRNIIFVPYWFCQLLWYAAHTDSIPEEKKLALLKKIVAHANAGGNVTVKAYGTEHIPRDGSFIKDFMTCWQSLIPVRVCFLLL